MFIVSSEFLSKCKTEFSIIHLTSYSRNDDMLEFNFGIEKDKFSKDNFIFYLWRFDMRYHI